MRNAEPRRNLDFCLVEKAAIGFSCKSWCLGKGRGGETGFMFGLHGIFPFECTIMHVVLLGSKKKEKN